MLIYLFLIFFLIFNFIFVEIDKKFINREFSFQLSNEAVIRHLSFSNSDELKAEIVKQCPLKIDVGAVYSAKVSN